MQKREVSEISTKIYFEFHLQAPLALLLSTIVHKLMLYIMSIIIIWPLGSKSSGVAAAYWTFQRMYKVFQRPGEFCRKPLDANSIGPIVMGSLGGGLSPAVDVLQLKDDDDTHQGVIKIELIINICNDALLHHMCFK